MKGIDEGVLALLALGFIVLFGGFAVYSLFNTVPVTGRTASQTTGGCVVTGCSGQICDDHEVATTCEYLPEYECYKSAKCERQGDGKCGWTQTPELQRCLATR